MEFREILRFDLGVVPTGLYSIGLPPPGGVGAGYQQARWSQFVELTEAIWELPGVRVVAGASTRPLGGGALRMPLSSGAGGSEAAAVHVVVVTRDDFDTLRVPLRSGRDVDESDHLDGRLVAMLSQDLARRMGMTSVPSADPLLLNGLPVDSVGIVTRALAAQVESRCPRRAGWAWP